MRQHRYIGLHSRLLLPVTTFLMTLGLAACDPPGTQSLAITQAAAAAPISDLVVLETTTGHASASLRVAPATALAAPEEIPISDRTPAGVEDVELTPMEDAGDPSGNALLAVRFRGDAIPDKDAIELLVDDNKSVLVRDSVDKARFTGMVFFDFDLFLREQEERKALLEATGEKNSPIFNQRELVGQEEFGFVEPEIVQQARAASIVFRIPRRTIAMPPSAVDPSRELFITDLSVVQDRTRTFDICGNVGNPNGAWTFKTLMTNMANQPVTGIDPATFVERWLRTWAVNNTINTFPVPSRVNILNQVVNNWPRLPDGRLNLDSSPFRLLAIVNRIDLRANPVYGGTGGNAGEGRFVFAVVNRSINNGCSVTQFNVIFEYGVPITKCTAIRNYAQQWINLGNIPLGSAAFNPALQAITDQFTAANAAPLKPNRSALNQLRTNEIALASPWELREFILPRPNGHLTLTTAKQTPHHTRNNTALLANYINTNAAAINAGNHSVPLTWAGQPFLTGSNFNFSVANGAVWNAPGVANQPRHMFSLATCNACHGGETRDNVGAGDTTFVHITPRLINQQSQISKFLRGNGTLALPTTFNKPDPINGAPIRQFGDLLRRQQDLANLINTSCRTAGFVHMLRWQPLDVVH